MSKNQFHSLTIKAIERNTPSCVIVEFEIPKNLQDSFQFKQGQYLTLRTTMNGEEVRRSYSLCTSPIENRWRVAIKKIEGGKFSTFANDVLKKGDQLEVMPPFGKFYVDCDETANNNYIAFAAGSGITPILSIIKTHLNTEPNATFKLFYINQTVNTIILKDEVEGLKNQFLDRFETYHFLTKESRNIPLFDGRLNEEKMDIIFSKMIDVQTINHCFICGPQEMIFMIKDFLVSKGMHKKSIHFELFGIGPVKNTKKKEVSGTSNMSEIVILEGGKTFNFTIPQKSDNILDAALQQSADLPFACKGGVCCTCKAKLIEGTIEMEVNYALEQEELDAGYILTCQAVPTSEKVTVDFDA